ncbi:hypothetical protein JW968_01925 [Candidatus Woesearchaeota archaeon]|nr:hypothetical protein [Candidatus Woesearchaeota archaeon]
MSLLDDQTKMETDTEQKDSEDKGFICNRSSHYLEESACYIGRDLQRVLPDSFVDEVLFHDCYWNNHVTPKLRVLKPHLNPSNINLFAVTADNITNNLGRPGKRTVVELGLYFNTLEHAAKTRETAEYSAKLAGKIYWHKRKNVLKERSEELDPWNELAAMMFGREIGLRFIYPLDFFVFREKSRDVIGSEFAKFFVMEYTEKKLEIEMYKLVGKNIREKFDEYNAAIAESYDKDEDPSDRSKASARANKAEADLKKLEDRNRNLIEMALESIAYNNVMGTKNFETFERIRSLILKRSRTSYYMLPHEKHYLLDETLPDNFVEEYYRPNYQGSVNSAIRFWTLWWFSEKVQGETEQERIEWLKEFSLNNEDLEKRITRAAHHITGWLGDTSQYVFSHNDTTLRHAFLKEQTEDEEKEDVFWYDLEKAGARRFGYDAVQVLNSRVLELGTNEFLEYMGEYFRRAYNQSGGRFESIRGKDVLLDSKDFDGKTSLEDRLVSARLGDIRIHPGLRYHIKASLYMKIHDSLHHIKNAVLGHIINRTDRQIFHYAPNELDLGTKIFSKPMIEFYRRVLKEDLLFIDKHKDQLGFTKDEIKKLLELLDILKCVTFRFEEHGVKTEYSPNLIDTEVS